MLIDTPKGGIPFECLLTPRRGGAAFQIVLTWYLNGLGSSRDHAPTIQISQRPFKHHLYTMCFGDP